VDNLPPKSWNGSGVHAKILDFPWKIHFYQSNEIILRPAIIPQISCAIHLFKCLVPCTLYTAIGKFHHDRINIDLRNKGGLNVFIADLYYHALYQIHNISRVTTDHQQPLRCLRFQLGSMSTTIFMIHNGDWCWC